MNAPHWPARALRIAAATLRTMREGGEHLSSRQVAEIGVLARGNDWTLLHSDVAAAEECGRCGDDHDSDDCPLGPEIDDCWAGLE